ncbi:uncharacterized protein LOC110858902 [Folsomia candida]|uniref:uncharacterized protein LOC110858902 n=1 Tax=Folsomia candida TaxID=158441 RepID=UPI000B8FA456|nr:uncharacterized protein LOC110858902 [Folsomia candida]
MIINSGLDITRCVSQAYDCASVMSDIKEVIGLIQAIYNYQSQSVRRSEYFKDAQAMIGYDKILELPKSCDTRWSSQKNGISYFHNRLDSVILALENISENGKPADLAECKGFLHQLKSFRTLLLIVILDQVLGHTNALSEYLQCSDLVYTRAINLCEATITTLSEMRNELMFNDLWKSAEALSHKVFVEVPDPNCVPVSKRRKTVRSKYLIDSFVCATTGSRCTEAGTIEQELRGVYYEVLDRFIQEMKRRLMDYSEILRGLSASDPLNEDFLNAEKVLNFCASFIRFNFNVDSLKAQLPVARNLIKAEKIDRTTKCYEYLQFMSDGFPDLIKYFALVLTFPVSSATAERSFSTLNRVKSFLRTTMQETRTSSLTILSTNRDLSSKLRENPMIVVDEFGKNPKRRLEFLL